MNPEPIIAVSSRVFHEMHVEYGDRDAEKRCPVCHPWVPPAGLERVEYEGEALFVVNAEVCVP